RTILAVSLTPFAGSHHQSSQALQNLQRQLGLIAGGEAGKLAATAVGLCCSADTLISRVINTQETKLSGSHHHGIYEWAWHRG
ncbi:ISL3 family transposase, partial [Escherichia coli]